MSINRILDHADFHGSSVAETFRRMPLGYIDVGARGGVHPLVEPVAGITAVLGFEPDAAECARLQAELSASQTWARCEISPTALAEREGPALLHVINVPTNKLLRAPNSAIVARYNMEKWREVGTVPLRTGTLDDALFGPHGAEPFWGEFIKLDTQGTEYEVLRGAQRTLRERTVAIVAEVEFFQVYEGQRLFTEVELMLRELGFAFYGFLTLAQRSCRHLNKRVELGRERYFFGDAVFFKDPLGANAPALTPRQRHCLFVCALLTEYYDFALELAQKTWATGEEALRLRRLVADLAARPAAASRQDIEDLLARIQAAPGDATLLVGKFVDRLRQFADCNDVSGEPGA